MTSAISPYLIVLGCILSATLQLSQAACVSHCHGHGKCTQSRCDCFHGWTGSDCAGRVCPKDSAWSDIPLDIDSAHNDAECSGRGTCDTHTGSCKCDPGFVGRACQRTACPNRCSNHGTCVSMAQLSESTLNPLTGLSLPYTGWDADKLWGCKCDDGYIGVDCSQMVCPIIADPIQEIDRLPSEQLLRCDMDPSGGGAFTLQIGQERTRVLSARANLFQVSMAINDLPNVRKASVMFDSTDGSTTTVCNTDGLGGISNMLARIGIQGLPEPVPIITPLAADGSALQGLQSNQLYTAHGTDGLLRRGEAKPQMARPSTLSGGECAGRGMCDRSSGACNCFTGFTSSSGSNMLGLNPDCGAIDSSVAPVQQCAGDQLPCSGHGVCSGSPTYRCTCDSSWTGADCSRRTCPHGKSWFHLPVAEQNDAHWARSECSSAGTCSRTSGRCSCLPGFTGEACQRLECPHGEGGRQCSGHGECLTMSELASKAVHPVTGVPMPVTYGVNTNDPATWDFASIQGCACEDGWTGHACELRLCPLGDDPATIKAAQESQRFWCSTVPSVPANAPPNGFVFRYGMERSQFVPSDADASAVTAALQAMLSISHASPVATFSHGSTVCAGPGVGRVATTVTFSGSNDDFDPLELVIAPGANIRLPPQAHTISNGNVEHTVCNSRGVCQADGTCMCEQGYGSSDGAGAAGTLGDCGYRMKYALRASLSNQGGL